MTVLSPRLCALDERVLAALYDGHGQRSDRVADLVLGAPFWYCDECGREVPRTGGGKRRKVCVACWDREIAAGPGRWVPATDMPRSLAPVKRATPEQRREVREILRGLEATGYATCRGGWWRRA